MTFRILHRLAIDTGAGLSHTLTLYLYLNSFEIINIREHDIGHKIYLGKLLGSLVVPNLDRVESSRLHLVFVFVSFFLHFHGALASIQATLLDDVFAFKAAKKYYRISREKIG